MSADSDASLFGLLRPEEAAARLGVSTATLARWANDGRVSVRRGRGEAGGWRWYSATEIELLADLRAERKLSADRAARIDELERRLLAVREAAR